jgi:hypothetical protein
LFVIIKSELYFGGSDDRSNFGVVAREVLSNFPLIVK